MNVKFFLALSLLILSGCLWSCSPKVQVQAPDKPITINLNVKIEHEIKVKVDQQLDSVISEDSGLF